MSNVCLSQDFIGKPIIDETTGQIIAKVVDVLIDPNVVQVAALVTSKGNLFERQIEAIPSHKVRVWGRDAILVGRTDVISNVEELAGSGRWLSVSDQVKGHEVVSSLGTRIGELNDVVVNAEGQLIAYDLGRVFIEGPLAESKRVAADTTQSFGQDVLIVTYAPDTAQVQHT
jgi:uncharacterized protein YrrD